MQTLPLSKKVKNLLANLDCFQVYSGKAGACSCGCAGKHKYAKEHVKYGAANRGYDISEDEISDRSVKLIINKLESNPNTNWKDLSESGGHVWVETETRLLVAYFKPTGQELPDDCQQSAD